LPVFCFSVFDTENLCQLFYMEFYRGFFCSTKRVFEKNYQLKSLRQSFSEVTIGQMPHQHVPPSEAALAEGAVFVVGLVAGHIFQQIFGLKIVLVGPLVQQLEHDLVADAVVVGQRFPVLALETAQGAGERLHAGEVGTKLVSNF